MSGLLHLAVGLGLVGLGLTTYGGYRWYHEKRKLQELETRAAEAEEAARADGGVAHTVGFDAPKLEGGLLGLLRSWRTRAKAKRMARKGYVLWYRIDGGNVKPPEWVKPERKGRGIREYTEDDTPYLFPDDALVTDSQTGARIAYHHVGEPEPINLNGPEHATLDGDELQELLNKMAEDEPAGGLGLGFDLTPQKLMWGMIIMVMAFAFIKKFLLAGGGA